MDDVIPRSETLTLGVHSDYTPKHDHEANNEEGEKSNGILTSFISTLVSPRSTKSGEFIKRKVEEEAEVEAGEIVSGETEKNVGESENGGGVISNMISSFFSPSKDRKGEEEVKGVGNHKRLKMDEEEEEGKGGLIDNIVSHLPTSIPGEVRPSTQKDQLINMERRKRIRNRKHLKMVAWKTWLCLKQSLLIPTKCFLIKITSRSRHKQKGSGKGLVSLYKDVETCGEYEDIKVMWEMIHTCPEKSEDTVERRKQRSSSYWRFCVHPSA